MIRKFHEGNYEEASEGYVYFHGKEINDQTYTISKSYTMIKGNDPTKIKNGSTLSDLRETENVPLKELVYDYFIREVKPHLLAA